MMSLKMWEGVLLGLMCSVTISVVMILFFTLGPIFEFRYMPVIQNFKAVLTAQTEKYREYNVSFDKVRSCDIDLPAVSWYFMNSDNQYERAAIELPPRKGDPTRPEGTNVSKGWKVFIPKGETVRSQIFIAYHDCHIGWRTRTEAIIDEK